MLGMMIEAIELCISIPVKMILNFIQGHSCMGNQKLYTYFLTNF